MYVYRFWNKEDEIIYIGRSKNLSNRLNNHTHLPRECYNQINKVEYSKLSSDDESSIYERYYINKYTPKYNIMMNNGSKFAFELPELKWKILHDISFEDKKSTKGWIKFNPNFDFNISHISIGRVLELSKLINNDGCIEMNRKELMGFLKFETKDSFRKFLCELEQEGVIVRINKLNKNVVTFRFSDDLFIKQ